MKILKYIQIAIIAIPVVLASCRGQRSQNQPIHPNMNMDQQNRFEAQEENNFFADGRSMRQPVEGTISRGNLRQDKAYFQGINEDSSFVTSIPVDVTKSFLYRGQKMYNIYCAPCHGKTGDGQGIIMTGQYGFVPAPTYHQDRLRNVEDGYLYSTIANGIRNMSSYAHQIEVKDRWAVVAYVRALQRSQYVPENEIQEYDVDLASLQQEYQDKLAAQQAREEAEAAASGTEEISAARGQQIYEQNACQTCHSRDGSDGVGPTHLNIFGRQEQLTDGSTVTADEEYIKESIVNPNAKIVQGYDPIMAPYSFLSDAEVQSLVEYLKTLSDNE
ncbi:MAG: c-type cytochrome [Balneolaceae bacterium]|nr:c-type cytochrome [Balneolaceae bacterium]